MDSIFPIVMNNIDKLRGELKTRFGELVNKDEFIKLTTLATSDEAVVKDRYRLVLKELIK